MPATLLLARETAQSHSDNQHFTHLRIFVPPVRRTQPLLDSVPTRPCYPSCDTACASSSCRCRQQVSQFANHAGTRPCPATAAPGCLSLCLPARLLDGACLIMVKGDMAAWRAQPELREISEDGRRSRCLMATPSRYR